MPRTLKRRPAPISIRLSDDERAVLLRRAGALPLSSYVKAQLFPDGTARRAAPRAVSPDRALLAQLLGQLGASGLAYSLTKLATAADSGSLLVDELTRVRLHNACEDVATIHQLLMIALGKELRPNSKVRLKTNFLLAALEREAAQ